MRMMPVACLALAAASAPAAAFEVDPAPCPAERAIYAMETDEGDFAAGFIPARHWPSVASNLYFRLQTPVRDYYFSFAVSNGYGGTTLIPVGDPFAPGADEDGPRMIDSGEEDGGGNELRFFAMDEALRVINDPPIKGADAPPFLMMPDIGLALWYSPSTLTDAPDAEAESMPRGVFKRVSCMDQAPREVGP